MICFIPDMKITITAKLTSRSFVVLVITLIMFISFTKDIYGQMWKNKTQYSQGTSSVLEKKFSLKLEKVSLHEALQIISKASGIIIIYGDTLVTGIKNISCNFQDTKLNEILDFVLNDTKLTYLFPKSSTLIIVEEVSLHKITGAITGTVINEKTGEPLASVNLQLNRTPWGTSSKNNGVYRFDKVTEGEYEMIASAVGYRKQLIPKIKVPIGEVSTVNIHLQPAVLELEEVVVTGNKIPTRQKEMGFSVTVIDAEQIEQMQAKSVTDLLRGAVPGMYHLDGDIGHGGRIYIRGVGSLSYYPSRGIAYYIDGVPVDGELLTDLTLDNIERVEIVRGPNTTALYGVDASEGVIQMFTKKGGTGSFNGALSIAGGIGKTDLRDEKPIAKEYEASIYGSTNVFSYSASGRYYNSDGILPQNDNYESKSLTFSSATTLTDNLDFSLFVRYLRNKQPEVMYQYRIREVFKGTFDSRGTITRDRILGGINGSYRLFPCWSHNLTLGLGKNDELRIDPQPLGTPQDSIQDERGTKNFTTFIGYNTTISNVLQEDINSTFTAGVEFFFKRIDKFAFTRLLKTGASTEDFPYNVPLFRNVGYFVQEKIELWDKLFITGGIRFEKNSYFGENLGFSANPRFSVSSILEPAPWWLLKLHGSIGRAVKAPPEQRGLYNPNLKPEINSGWEIGIENYLLNGSLQLQATYFNQLNKNLVVEAYATIPEQTDPVLQYINVGEISNKGWEFAITYSPFKIFKIGGTYSIFFNRLRTLGNEALTFLNETDGGPVKGTAKDAGSFFVDVKLTNSLNLYADVYYVGKRKANQQKTMRKTDLPPSQQYLEPFTKVNLTIHYQIFKHLTIFLKAKNIVNSKIDELELIPAPQQNILGGLKVIL
ncbi:MAG: TonB-dependent receptor [Ignavibacteriaceae bacterium]